MLKLNGISKTFGTKQVLNNINLEINQGEVFGLVGENGAGKTTLLNIISQVLAPTKGTVEIDGKVIKSLNDLKGKIGYIIDIPALHNFLTAREYLEFLASPQKLSKEELKQLTNILLRKVNLEDSADKYIKGFSRGMRQRLGIAGGLVSNPEIVLMDEPSSALDPKGRADVLKIISDLAEEGKTVILSTHILGDIEKVCSRVGLIVGGEMDITGSVKDLLKAYQDNVYIIDCDKENIKSLVDEISKLSSVTNVEVQKDGFVAVNFNNQKEILNAIKKLKTPYNGFYLKKSSIEEIFLKANVKRNNIKGEFYNKLSSMGIVPNEEADLIKKAIEDKYKTPDDKEGGAE